jgi:hypothetical protein
MRIENPRDFFGALGLLALASFVFWATWDLPGQRGFQFGAGTAPRLFALLLAANAAAVMIGALFTDGPRMQYTLRAAAMVSALGLVGLSIYWLAGPWAAVAALTIASFAALRLLDRFAIRGPVLVAVAVLGFATFVKPAGLLISTFVLIVVSSAASHEFRPKEALLWAAALSIFSSFLFSIVLNLPMPVFPAI